MQFLNLLLWVGQFGFSLLFPLVCFLCLAAWLQVAFRLGMWVMALAGILGLLTAIPTAKSCLQALRKSAEEASHCDPFFRLHDDH